VGNHEPFTSEQNPESFAPAARGIGPRAQLGSGAHRRSARWYFNPGRTRPPNVHLTAPSGLNMEIHAPPFRQRCRGRSVAPLSGLALVSRPSPHPVLELL